MSFTPDSHPHKTRPHSNKRDSFTRSTQPLDETYNQLADMPTAAHAKLTKPLITPVSSTKQPVIIPATASGSA